MNRFLPAFSYTRLLAVLLITPLLLFWSVDSQAAQKKRIIFDTDMGPDYDDVGALAMLHVLADKKEAVLLGTIASNRHEKVVPCIGVLNTWFGRPTLPIAAPTADGPYLTSSHKKRWTDHLPAQYPHPVAEGKEVPDAVELYRFLLAQSASESVVIVTVGFMTNISALLRSGPDKFSPLTGLELVRQKVALWVAMAGKFPSGKEFNVEIDARSALYAVENWPGEILFSGFEIGEKVLTGKRVITQPNFTGPVRDTYTLCMNEGDKEGRPSWDQTAVLAAVRGISPWFGSERGTMRVLPDGSNQWNAESLGKHTRLLPRMPSEELAKLIEELMITPPKGR